MRRNHFIIDYAINVEFCIVLFIVTSGNGIGIIELLFEFGL